jgi:protein-disulfide isomerase
VIAFSFRAVLVGFVLAFVPLLMAVAADERTIGGVEKATIEKAIEAYAANQQADKEKAIDQLIANRMTSLLGDPGTQVLGNPQGDVTIIEFFDYTCPFCKAAEPRLEQLLKEDKKVKLVIKEFPILRPVSLVAAKASLASVKQGKYPVYHQTMMNFRGQLTEEAIFDMAKQAGLDVERLRTDMNAPEIADAIIGNFNLARALRIFDTPTFIIGNHLVREASTKIDFQKTVAALRTK